MGSRTGLLLIFALLALIFVLPVHSQIPASWPCRYAVYKGECQVVGARDYGIVNFYFRPYGLISDRIHEENVSGRILIAYAGYMGIDCLKGTTFPIGLSRMHDCHIDPGAIFDCNISVISNGSCSPFSYAFGRYRYRGSSCVAEGSAVYKGVSYMSSCCPGLTLVNDSGRGHGADSSCISRYRGITEGICTRCGDGRCGTGENECNCPKDCPATTTCAKENEIFQAAVKQCCSGLIKTAATIPCTCPSGMGCTCATIESYTCKRSTCTSSLQGAACTAAGGTVYCGNGGCSCYCPTNCTAEGQVNYFGNPACCSGLTSISNAQLSSAGTCVATSNGASFCTYCGNGVCGSGENKCNCPKDCPATGCVIGIKTDICCSCPQAIARSQVGTNGWVMYELGKAYSSFPKVENCQRVACSPCRYPYDAACSLCGNGKCETGETFTNCARDCPQIVGGNCSYKYFAGKCTVTNVTAANSGSVEVDYSFTPTGAVDITGTFLASADLINPYKGSTYAGYLGLSCLKGPYAPTLTQTEGCGVNAGAIFDCVLSVATSGSCTPINVRFLDNGTCLGEGKSSAFFETPWGIRYWNRQGMNKTCCGNLTNLSIALRVNDTGECEEIPGLRGFVCTNCGNGECSKGENRCNCPQDCPNITEAGCSQPSVVDSETVCASMVVYAKNPKTKRCCSYANACEAPKGWKRFYSKKDCLNFVDPGVTGAGCVQKEDSCCANDIDDREFCVESNVDCGSGKEIFEGCNSSCLPVIKCEEANCSGEGDVFMDSNRQCCEGLLRVQAASTCPGGGSSGCATVVSYTCVKCSGEGEKIYMESLANGRPTKCCFNLTAIKSCTEGGTCTNDGSSICARCGNGVCGTGENKVNCPQDCSTNVSACPAPASSRHDCWQSGTPAVVVYAKDPKTGVCCEYKNSCLAPSGWRLFYNRAQCLAVKQTCSSCSDGTACGRTNTHRQECACVDLDNDRLNELCRLASGTSSGTRTSYTLSDYIDRLFSWFR